MTLPFSLRRRYLAAAFFSLVVHLPGLASPLTDYHHHRQVNTAAIARNYRDDGMPFLHPRINWEGPSRQRAATEFPLYMYMMGGLWDLGGLGDLWGRILSVAFSALSAMLLLWLLGRWLDPRPAFFASLLFSLIPVEIYFGRTVQPEALALAATLGAFCGLDYFLAGKGRAAGLGWILGALCAAVAVGHKIPYGYLFGVCLVLMWARRGSTALRSPALWAFVPAGLGLAACWYLYAKSGTYVVPTEAGSFISLLDYSNLPYYVFFQFFSRLPELGAGWPGMALLAVGAWSLAEAPKRTRVFLAGWAASVAIYAALGGGYVHNHDYTALPWAPVNAALMGLGLDRALRWADGQPQTRRARARLALAALVAAVPVYSIVRIAHWYRTQDDFLLSAKPVVDAVSSPGDLFLCDERAPSFFLYYIGRNGWSEAVDEMQHPPMRWIQEGIDKGAKFYMTRAKGVFSNRNDPRTAPVYQRFPLVYEGPDFLIFRLAS